MAMNIISEFATYANLQMAAEALYGIPNASSSSIGESSPSYTGLTYDALFTGNAHASKFPPSLIADLTGSWKIVAHQPNTSTGFSGTLFEATENDFDRGIQKGELVLSFRSTEFIDDAVRDTQVTNKSIKETGWAFGQLADMQAWYKELSKTGGPLDNKSFVVTGYSLGGHLATAFPLLCSGASAVYTFNGAGVGGLRGETLSSVVKTFQTLWKNTGKNSGLFKDTMVAAMYKEYVKNNTLSAASAALLRVRSEWPSDARLLQSAIDHVADVQKEIARIISDIEGAAKVPGKDIAGLSLDYWLGVLKAAESTFSENTVQSTLSRTPPSSQLYGAPVYNLYGMETADALGNPSGVANSQNHYGTDVPVFIESQPLLRGVVGPSAFWQSALYTDIKLLVPNFAQNDFGDTHSLVLLVDSLAVQDLFAQLDPAVTLKHLQDIFDAATATQSEISLIGGQGKAEGYTLETVLNGLIKTLTSTDPKLRDIKTKGGLSLDTGNTWHDIEAREALYKAMTDLKAKDAYKALLGKVTLVTPATGANAARTDFGQFLALVNLTPFALKVTDATALAALKSVNEPLAQAWEADAQLSTAQRSAGAGHYTDLWLADRASMLSWILKGNTADKTELKSLAVGDEAWSFRDVDSTDSILILPEKLLSGTAPRHYVAFGGAGADALSGAELADHLYGGAGDDTLIGFSSSDHLEGGAGNDTYLVDASGGGDWIVDSDGQGIVKWSISGAQYTLAGGKKLSDGTWKSTDGRFVYSLVANAAGQKDLNVMADSGVLRVRNYISGQLGIVLDAVEGQKAAGAGTNENDRLINTQGSGLVQAAGLAGNDLLVGAADSTGEWFDGGPGRDMLIGRMGNDTLSGGADADLIIGGNGSDVIDGGAGNDLILNGTRYKRAGSGSVVDHNAFTWNKPWLIYAPYWQWGSPTGATLRFKEARSELIGWSWDVTMQTGAPDNNFGFTEDTYLPADSLALVGSDTILAGAGADMIAGSGGDDLIDGGGDDDLISGLEGNERILGGSGNDQIAGNEGKDLIDGGSGLDTLWGGIGADSIFGSDGADQIFGDFGVAPGIGADRYALSGNDFISGGEGDDLLSGDGGADTVFGDSGNDEIVGDEIGLDVIYHGNDELYGGSGGDTLYGLGGSDSLFGGADDDFLFGDSNTAESIPLVAQGNDLLDGGDGNDQLVGDAGSDTLIGGAGRDTLSGGDGDDVYVFEKGDFAVDASKVAETILDSGGEDTLVVQGYRADELFLFKMADVPGVVVLGSQGGEALALPFAGSGIVERIFIRNQGDGVSPASKVLVQQMSVSAASEPSSAKGVSNFWVQGYTVIPNMELFGRSPFAMSWYGYENANDTFYGGMVDDYLFGNSGNDELYGQGGRDTLLGAAGDDLLVGGAGNDSMVGGDGLDVYRFDAGFGLDVIDSSITKTGFEDVIRFGPGISITDVFFYRSGSNLDIFLDPENRVTISGFFQGDTVSGTPSGQIEFDDGVGLGYSEVLSKFGVDAGAIFSFGSSGNDQILIVDISEGKHTTFAFEGDDVIEGSRAKHDTLYGGEGDDTIYGDSYLELFDNTGVEEEPSAVDKSDYLLGDEGNDELYGCGGEDTLDGGAGNDLLWGGKGNDKYVINVRGGSDTIDNWGRIATDTSTDVLDFGDEIKAEDIVLIRLGDDLKVVDRDARFEVVISNAFFGGASLNSNRCVDEFHFGGGVAGGGIVWTLPQLNSKVTYSTPDDDVIILSKGFWAVNAGSGDDVVWGSVNADTIYGDAGNDSLHGEYGADSLVGGSGNDVYWVSNPGAERGAFWDKYYEDTVVENPDEGIDTLIPNTYSAELPENVENLIVYQIRQDSFTYTNEVGSAHWFVGNSKDNLIDVSAVARVATAMQIALNGKGGADTLVGGDHNEVYYVHSNLDVVLEKGVGVDGRQLSVDAVESEVGIVLPENVENLTLRTDRTRGVGNSLNNLLMGRGECTLEGLSGDDTYYIPASGMVLEGEGEGFDVVNLIREPDCYSDSNAYALYNLSDFRNVEVLSVDVGDSPCLIGTDRNDRLSGKGWGVTVVGGAGDDRIFGESTIGSMLDGGDGNDYLESSHSAIFSGWSRPSGVVLGGRGEDKIVVIGTDDTVDGGEGNDLITLDGVAPTVRFGMGSGYDRIVSSGTWLRIELGANIRVGDFSLSRVDGQIILVLTDGSRLDILGAVPSIRFGTGVIWESRAVEVILAGGVFLEGGLGGDILNGEEGADSLWGNDGDDSLFGYDGMDSLIGDLGNDVIWGGEGDDFLEGGAGADFLGGGQGNDLLEGGEGVDCYLLNAGFGSDTIRFYWSEEGGLADKILFKNVRSSSELIFSRLDADSLVVSVVGTSDSILVRDFFHFYSFGGAYSECADVNISYVDEGGVERSVSGNIIREALLAPTSGGDLIIGLNGSNDRIVGLGGDDTLIAIGGEDTLVGGAGSDVYGVFLDYYHYRCVVIDNFDAAAKDEDFDVINGESDMYADAVGVVRVNDDLCLSFARVEDNKSINSLNVFVRGYFYLDGTTSRTVERINFDVQGLPAGGLGYDQIKALASVQAGLNIHGSESNDFITGSAGADSLGGSGGDDVLIGGTGNDIYLVDSTGDIVTEVAAGGTDTVQASVTYTLATEVENLTLTGTSAINGTGNALANVITGNAAANVLDGGAGNDTLSGGLGNNTYLFGKGDGQDYINALDDAAPGKLNVLQLKAGIVQSEVILTVSVQPSHLLSRS
jgi:Ca2+-binding RTX toxin-like protein